MTLNATEQAVLNIVTGDLAGASAPIVTFLEDLEAADGNLGLEAAAVLQLEGALPAAGLSVGIELQNQLLSFALTKLKAYIASKSPVSTVVPAPAPTAAKPA